MAKEISLTFDLDSTDYDAKLSFVMYYNGNKVYKCNHVNKKLNISLIINDTIDNIHNIIWTMNNKDSSHTIINEFGEIIKDASLITSNFKLSNFKLADKLTNNAYYVHDHNGTAKEERVPYDNFIGCNGTVYFTFSSPAHIWILEN